MRSINSFAEAVHRLRREKGMSLGDIASETGYSPSYLSKMLHGRRRLLPVVVGLIDKALHAQGELERIARDQEPSEHMPPKPMQLPPAPADFVGRGTYLHQLDAALIAQDRPGGSVTAVIEGGFWVGKTALALQWAARVADRFPGGCLFADLRGLAPGTAIEPGVVLNAFLRALGAGTDALHGSLADRAARYRSLLATRPAVVVLDNIASYEQVQHLLPGAGSAVVVTSREHQPALLAHSSGLHIDLSPLTPGEALQLLRRRVGEARVNAELSAAEAVVRRCGRLPMAVLIAAEHIGQHHHGSLSTLADDLATEARRLDLFTSPDPSVNIHGVIDLSYLALPPQAQRVFRLVGISPARHLSPESAAALTGLRVGEAREALDLLRHAHLLEETHSGRTRANHLLRAYAYRRAMADEPQLEVTRARDRVLRWYLATAWTATNALAPNWSGTGLTPLAPPAADIPVPFTEHDYDAAMAWCEAEATTAIHVARTVRDHHNADAGWMLPAMFLPFFYLTKNWGGWLTAANDGLAAAREAGSTVGVAYCTQTLGWVQHELGHTQDAVVLLRHAINLQNELGDDRARAWSEFGLAAAYTALERHEDAREAYQLAETLFADVGLEIGVAMTRAMLSGTHQTLGDTGDANAAASDALALAQALPSKPVTSLAHHRLGLVLLQQHQYRAALNHFDAALALRRTSRERWGQSESLIARAETLSKLGDTTAARNSYLDALGILTALHDPRALDIQAHVATLNACLHSRDNQTN
jgi:tetratricopeptide (TPR) repeat protein/transcriptional regulator with XRE-family HTH domain